MKIPPKFYYYRATSGVSYGLEPTNSIDVSKLITGKKYFKKQSVTREKLPKTLILADWSARNWSDEKLDDVKSALMTLLNEGFSLAVWHAGKILPLSLETLTSLDDQSFRAGIRPVHDEKIYQKALTGCLKTPRDAIEIIDSHALEGLLNETETHARVLKSSQIKGLLEYDKNVLLDVLKKAKPVLSECIYDEFQEKHDFEKWEIFTNKIKEHSTLNNLSVSCNIQQINISANKKITSLELGGLLMISSGVKEIFISGCKDLDSDMSFSGELKELKQLEIFNSNISYKNFTSILSKAKNLNSLVLSRREGFKINPELAKKSLPKLDSLEYKTSNEEGLLNELINATETLSSLNLLSNKSFIDLDIEKGRLKNLKILSFNFSKIKKSQLEKFFKASEAIEILDISRLNQVNSLPPAHCIKLDCLKELRAHHSKFPYAEVLDYLKHSPNIKKLSLGGRGEDAKAHFEYSVLDLKKLETVDFYFSKMTSQFLYGFLKACPNIKAINFHAPGNEPVMIQEDSMTPLGVVNDENNKLSLTSLEKLMMTNVKVSCGVFKKIINATCDLKELNLPVFDGIYAKGIFGGNKLKINPYSLLELKKISFEGTNIIDPSTMTFLLNSIENVEVIDLGNIGLIDNPYSSNFKLKRIKELIFKEGSQCGFIFDCIENDKKTIRLSYRGTKLGLSILMHSIQLNKKLKDIEYSLEMNDVVMTNIQLEDFFRVFSCSQKIKTVSLSEGWDFSKGLNEQIKALSHVESLELKKPKNIDVNKFYTFIKSTNSKLNKLTVDGQCFGLKNEPDIERAFEMLDACGIKKRHSIETNSTQKSASRPPCTRNLDSEVACDASNSGENELDAEKIFYSPLGSHPKVSSYRLESFNHVEINKERCESKNAFKLKKEGNMQWRSIEGKRVGDACDLMKTAQLLQARDERAQYYYGHQTLLLSDKWQSLASVSANDSLLNFKLSKEIDVEIKYSNRDGLYYIRAKKDLATTVDTSFVIKVENKNSYLRPELQEMVNEFDKYGAKPLDMPAGLHTGEEYLKAIQKQKLGACRHRALAFMMKLKKDYPKFTCRIIGNDVHAFVEVKCKNSWVTCDLGGAPATLNIIENKELEQAFTKESALEKMDEKQTQIALSSVNYSETFNTWSRGDNQSVSMSVYCNHLIFDKNCSSQLIEMSNSHDVLTHNLALSTFCREKGHPIFYVDKPEDLICSVDFIVRYKDSQGLIEKGPGGPCHDFLLKNRNNASLLLVNYSNFSASDIVRFNALLDTTREADGTPLPKDIKVIGVINVNAQDCYHGGDFYSRFDKVASCPLSSKALNLHFKKPPTVGSLEARDECFAINLYQGGDYKERLLGKWVLNGQDFIYQEGMLNKALKQVKPIVLQNAPWDDEQFVSFWARLSQGLSINHQGELMSLPPKTYQASEGYDWKTLEKNIELVDSLSNKKHVLNPSLLKQCLGAYHCKNNQLLPTRGWLKESLDETVEVYLTRDLSLSEWAELLTECQHHSKCLRVECAPGVEIPTCLGEKRARKSLSKKDWQYSDVKKHTSIIITKDQDLTQCQLLYRDDMNYQIIDVTECGPSDLLERISATGKSCGHFEFQVSQKALLTALQSNKKVLLKGRFSKELIDCLAPLLLERLALDKAQGKLVILCDSGQSFNFCHVYKHQITMSEKISFLEIDDASIRNAIKPYLNKEGLCRLKARRDYLRTHPNVSSDDAWIGLESLSNDINFTLAVNDFSNSAQRAKEFTYKRQVAVNEVLAHHPYVFLTGLTGVGKSTFVEKELCKKGEHLHLGESSILAWAKDKSVGRKFLFLDEANLSQRQWSEFEGLFNIPAAILIDGDYHQLSPEHKVIFAGNPLNYGDDRQLAQFFKRHGNAVCFKPLSMDVIYEKVLKPVFEGSVLKEHTSFICRKILEVYGFILQIPSSRVLISPRELQMMALAVCTDHKVHPQKDLTLIIQHAVFNFSHALIPDEHVSSYQQQFKPVNNLPALKEDAVNDYFITQSRQSVIQQLDVLLKLQNTRQQGVNEAQRFGGLGGVVLEGLPGIGKSELVIKFLHHNGYKKQGPNSVHHKSNKPYYLISASMPLDEKKNVLLKAFDEGAVVVCDEMNSTPCMERLLNSLLMGKNLDGSRPIKPGFFIIATQNPASLAGRHTVSTALSRRLLSISLPEYEKDEMVQILIHQGVDDINAHALCEAYKASMNYGKKHGLSPLPNFRDLLKFVKILQAPRTLSERAKVRFSNDCATHQLSMFNPEHSSTSSGYFASDFSPQ